MEPIIGGAARPGGPDLIKNGTTATFMADVIDASHDSAVVVDFWAPWCGPCKQLGPLLEKAVREANGAVRMVKVNIDESPEIAQQMRIQSIPAVYAFKDGGRSTASSARCPRAKSSNSSKSSAERPGRRPIQEALEMAKEAFAAGDAGSAAGIYSQILQQDPENLEALAGLTRGAILRKEFARAREFLARVPQAQAGHAEIATVRAALDLAEAGDKASGAVGELRARLAADPNDHQARLESRHRAVRRRRARGGDRRAPRRRQAGARMERAGGPQAARQVLRSDGTDRSADADGAAPIVVDPLLVGRRGMSAGSIPAMPSFRRHCRSFRSPGSCSCRAASCRSTYSSRATSRWCATRSPATA